MLSRESTAAILVQDSKRSVPLSSRRSLRETLPARSRPWPDQPASRARHLLGVSSSEALSPAHLAVIRACGVAARSFISERCSVAGRRNLSNAMSSEPRSFTHPRPLCCGRGCARSDPAPLDARDRSTAMHALLLMSAHELFALRRSSPHADMFARNEAANSRLRLRLATRPLCCHIGVVAAFHVRARCTIRLFDGHAFEARGCASCFSLLGARDPRARRLSTSREFRARGSVPAVARSLSAAALMLALRRS